MAIPAPVYRVTTQQDFVYLTFDDGPYAAGDVPGRVNATTDALLDKLSDPRKPVSEGGVNDPDLAATFFVNAWTFVRVTPDGSDDPSAALPSARRIVGKRILHEGHDIANHSFRHVTPWGTWDRKNATGIPSVQQMIAEINECRKAIALLDSVGQTGKVVPHFRSPGDPSYWPVTNEERASPAGKGKGAERVYENQNAPELKKARFRKLLTAAQLTNLRYVSYNLWGHDELSSMLAQNVFLNIKNRRLIVRGSLDRLSFELLGERKGAIILLHSGRSHTVNAIVDIVKYIYDEGYQVRKLPAAL